MGPFGLGAVSQSLFILLAYMFMAFYSFFEEIFSWKYWFSLPILPFFAITVFLKFFPKCLFPLLSIVAHLYQKLQKIL
ncbi:MAG: hypothetical protein CM15mP83_4620 [Flavobacteriaceae bacterium]|nr:MAG: hypothetical protein CM15mP83_4620 [Flavobacteriaceae bacterium]